jgi:hypothetical protein
MALDQSEGPGFRLSARMHDCLAVCCQTVGDDDTVRKDICNGPDPATPCASHCVVLFWLVRPMTRSPHALLCVPHVHHMCWCGHMAHEPYYDKRMRQE